MIKALLRTAIHNRVLVLLLAALLALAGFWSLRQTPVDAIPDLSETQVIVKASWPGQSPQVLEDQLTHPLTTALLGVPGATAVRGFSMFGDAFVYVLFDEKTDLYWARSRVLESLSQLEGRLPEQAEVSLGPDATGVGWIYTYALVDRSGGHDLDELRALQDWFLRYELQSVPGVAEVATVGGMLREYQVMVDPLALSTSGVSLQQVMAAAAGASGELGASVLELGEAEYMVRARGYLTELEELRQAPLRIDPDSGSALTLGQVARIQEGPAPRRGIAELNGQGEVVGAIVVMRDGENAREVIRAVEARLDTLKASLPDGVEVVMTHSRAELIDDAVATLYQALAKEVAVVVLVCALFLLHLRSSLVVLFSLPLGLLAAFTVMRLQGLNINIMSLGGLAIAIGAMVDGAIVMVENLHRHLQRNDDRGHWQKVLDAAQEVGPALFFSLLIVTVSFLPVFALQAQEGKLFAPLAFTKTWAMAASAGLAVTLVPVLMGYLVRGPVVADHANPVNRLLIALGRPLLRGVVRYPLTVLLLALAVVLLTLWPWRQLGSEFMPPLDEGDLMYMPTTHAGLSVGKARELLQRTDAKIAAVPEVASVFGKIGRADTATDPAPLTMVETLVRLKPESEWRPGMTRAKLRQELESLIDWPGVSNAWVMPIRTRIDMLATGIRTPVGVLIAGEDLAIIEQLGQQLEALLDEVPGTASAFAERVQSGRYLDIEIDRASAARHGLGVVPAQQLIQTALAGRVVGESVQGLARYPIRVRYARQWRDSPEALRRLPLVTAQGQQLVLGDIARIVVSQGPPMIRSENARPVGTVLVDLQEGTDLGGYVQRARAHVQENLSLPPGYSLTWTGQYQHMLRAQNRLMLLVPATLLLIAMLLYLHFRRFSDVLILMLTLPVAWVGAVWLMWWLDYRLSVAVAVGFIALAGLAVELGVLMLLYLHQAWAETREKTLDGLRQAVLEGASRRLRPLLMTSATVVLGLIPVMLTSGTGSEVMQRIAAPMVGGMLSALLLAVCVVPALFYLREKRGLVNSG